MSIDSARWLMPCSAPLVTVLMPVHNAGEYLREAVESILIQSFTDFEFLIINDGSTDGAFESLRSIEDPRLRLVDNPHNLGLIATLNRGLQLARAPLLARMDADDRSLPTRLERQVAAFAENPSLALLGTWAEIIGPDGTVIDQSRTAVSHAEIVRQILCNNVFIHPSIMARTDVLRKLGGFPLDAQYAEDYALWLRIVAMYEAANLPERLLQYRVHSGQVSQRKLRAQRRVAEKLQANARRMYAASGLLPLREQMPPPTLLDRLSAKPGTLGADYLNWARRNRTLGQWREGASLASRGLIVAPLCLGYWRLMLPPRAVGTDWCRRALNRLYCASQ